MMDKQAQTLAGRFGVLWDAVQQAVRPIGEELIPVVKELANVAISVVGRIGEFIKANKAAVVRSLQSRAPLSWLESLLLRWRCDDRRLADL